MTYVELAQGLKAHLRLEHEPIGLVATDQPPPGIRVRQRMPASACVLWREAENEMFFASAEDHSGCSVGAYVMGLPMSAATQDGLAGAVKMMAEVHYLSEQEVGSIPTIPSKPSGVIYGPLKDFSSTPDCAVVWTTPEQAMLLNEALETVHWHRPQASSLKLLGRPACGAVANTCNTKSASLSLGCSGMRLFTDIASSLSLFVIPGIALSGLLKRLKETIASNDKMMAEYQRKKAAMTAANQPAWDRLA